jgi:precorrin-3B synthase
VQLRGLSAAATEPLADRLAAAGLLPSETHERVRNVIASALTGRDGRGYLDVRPWVTELDRGLCADPVLAGLPGRFLFTLDDGRADVTGLGADVALLAGSADTVTVLLGGVDTGLRVTPATAIRTALAAARAFLDERSAQTSAAWRLSELDDGPARVTRRLEPPAESLATVPASPVEAGWRTGRDPLGPLLQTDGRISASVLAPLALLNKQQLTLLVQAAEAAGGEVLVTPWRGVIVPDLPESQAARWLAALADAGLVTDPDSPWVGVTSCAGRPGCGKALADVRADASDSLAPHSPGPDSPGPDSPGPAELSDGLTPAGDALLPVHWIGCDRACGRPAGKYVEVLATPTGYRVSVAGTERIRNAAPDQLAATVHAARSDR